MARTYKRDSRGRFASGGSSSGSSRRSGAKLPSPTKRTASGKPQRRQGLLTQRSSLARSQAKLKGKDTGDKSLTAQLSLRAQKAAVTRAKNKLAAAQKTGRIRLSGRDGMIKPRRGGAKKVAKPIGWMQSATARADRADPVLAKQRKKEANALRAMPKTARRAIATESAARRVRWKGKGDLTMDKYIIAISDARMQLASNHGKRKNKLSPGQIKAIYRSMEGPARKLRLLMKDVLKGAPLPTSRVVPRGTGRRVRMALAPNRIAGRTGQGKMLNKYNSRPQAVRGRIINGKYVKRENLRGRQPLDLSYESDRAYARTIARTAGRRQAGVVRQQQRQTTEQRRSVAEAKQKALIAPLVGTRKRGTKKQRRSIQILERAKSFYERGNNVDTLFVNVNRPGFRLPRSKRS